ncbi:(4Fe-4S)-binding protein [Chengkuizengella axinellae]|uniref:(4Fe-4S)-binding protein n=1 Tax=Chengkuizengella axinellae TaxID=3064388 RepID=A0ABT9J5U9_9BACL|nr:(4Fe-4S)-binding protein [Chengkuizengella sp. 2205SS18-9]MDP5276329.1 (4Fe-4S)-binding protein [Chengkuizengella sp. 2205SS18-9]
MTTNLKKYTGEHIDVTFNRERCIHAAKCVRGLPNVFNLKNKPWINADAETADKIAEVIERCPSGALKYTRKDGQEQEKPKPLTSIEESANGTLFVRGNLSIKQGEEEVQCNRAALCGCGLSKNKPFCDNSHQK